MRKVSLLAYGLAMLCVLGLASVGYGGDAPAKTHVFKLPVYLAEGLQIKKDTPATAALLEQAMNQCIDAQCNKQVKKCKAQMAKCVLSPPAEALKENRLEHEGSGKTK